VTAAQSSFQLLEPTPAPGANPGNSPFPPAPGDGARPRRWRLGRRDAGAGNPRLPAELRARDAVPALVRGVRIRAAVAGTSGTSALTRLALQALRARGVRAVAKASAVPDPTEGTAALVRRELARRAFEDAFAADLRRGWPVEALVVAGGDPVPQSARDFQARFLQATHVLVPSLARDPVDGSHRPDPERAVACVAGVPAGAFLVSGERDPGLRRVLREAALQADVRFVDASPRDKPGLPGVEAATVLDRFLRLALWPGLTAGERVQAMARLQRGLRWSPSALPELRWFDAAGLRQPPALRAAIDHLARQERRRVLAVAHVASDAEAAWLAPVLRQALQDEVLAHAYLAGPAAARAMPILHDLPATAFHAKTQVHEVVRTLQREGHGAAVVRLGDRGSVWARALESRLRPAGTLPGAWTPLPDDVPEEPAARSIFSIPQAHPAIGAPRMGHRPKVNILGDPDVPRPAPKPAFVAEQVEFEAIELAA
jgi:hypothetical protein